MAQEGLVEDRSKMGWTAAVVAAPMARPALWGVSVAVRPMAKIAAPMALRANSVKAAAAAAAAAEKKAMATIAVATGV